MLLTSFGAKWDADGYVSFLEANGFKVNNSKRLNSTNPMTFVSLFKTVNSRRIKCQ